MSAYLSDAAYWQREAQLARDTIAAKDAEIAALRAALASRDTEWFSLVMNAAASIRDASHCLRDPAAKRVAEGSARYYQAAANTLFFRSVEAG